jgi:transcriptional regulator
MLDRGKKPNVYVPVHFRLEDLAEMHALIMSAPLGMIVTKDESGFQANHLPLFLDREAGPRGTLGGHFARANPQAAAALAGDEALIVFRPAEAYVTPSLYPSKAEHGKVVPTWNFVAVHVNGRLRAIDDNRWLDAHLAALTRQQESRREHPWAVSDAPSGFIDQMKRAIIGFELTIESITGKSKVSQNRPEADRVSVLADLTARGSVDPAARLMADRLAPHVGPREG